MRELFYESAEKYASEKLGRPVKLANCSLGLTLTPLQDLGMIGEIISIETDEGPLDIFVPFSLSESGPP